MQCHYGTKLYDVIVRLNKHFWAWKGAGKGANIIQDLPPDRKAPDLNQQEQDVFHWIRPPAFI